MGGAETALGRLAQHETFELNAMGLVMGFMTGRRHAVDFRWRKKGRREGGEGRGERRVEGRERGERDCTLYRVVIKGRHDDDAVLCTPDSTHDLRVCETSNTLLLCPTLSYPSNHIACG